MADSTDPARRLDLLLSRAGQDLLGQLGATPLTPANELRLASDLRKHHAADLVAAVLGLLSLRQRGRAKFSRAEAMYFTRSGLEQATAESIAIHHAQRFAAFGEVADLCCGIGGDLVALAAASRVLGVDHDQTHLHMASLNAEVHGRGHNVHAHAGDVRTVDLAHVQGAFIDPTRRSDERRLRPGSSEPPLRWCFELAATLPLAIKAAPGLPLELVPPNWEIEFVADGRELKEALLWSPRLATAKRRATVLPHTLTPTGGPPVEVAPPGAYLLDPSPAITRAGLVEDLARTLDAWKIDAQIAFLSSSVPIATPFARTLRIEASLPWNLKPLRAALRALNVGSVDIRKRGSAVDVDDLQRRLKLHGARAATVVLTRVRDRPWAFVCSDAPPDQ